MAIYPVPASREAWLKLRQDFIGGSESPSLFAAQANYAPNLFELFYVKAGKIPTKEVSAEIVEAGVFMEPSIANWACHRHGWTQRPAVFAVDDIVKVVVGGVIKGMSGTLDRVIEPSPEDVANGFVGPGVLECKNVGMVQAKRAWIDDAEPAYVQIQLQHNMACSGFKWGATAMLDGGNRLVVNKYLARQKMHSAIRAKATEFWERVRDNLPYPPDGLDATGKALTALYPELEDDVLEFGDDEELAGLCEIERELCARTDSDKKEIERIRNVLRVRLGNHKRGLISGEIGYRITAVQNPGYPDRTAKPGEIIKGKKPSAWAKITPFGAKQDQPNSKATP